MMYSAIRVCEMTADLTKRWMAIQEAVPRYGSPYFRPEFTQAVATVRDDVFVGIIEDQSEIVGFFPFHRLRGRTGRPVGLGLSDYHGVVADPAADWSADGLLRGCGILSYDFDHLIADQRQFQPDHREIAESSIVDLGADFATYEQTRMQMGGKQLKETYRRIRKLEREHEPYRFVLNESDPRVFSQMVAWKRQQCQSTGVIDYFARSWTVDLVRRIHQNHTPKFGGNLAALYVGDDLVAVHFVMHTDRIWHSWFPGYDHRFRQYSPGLILLLELIRAGCQATAHQLDFGKGLSAWKASFRTHAVEIASGRKEIGSWRNQIRRVSCRLEQWARTSALNRLLRIPGKIIARRDRGRRYG